MVDYRLPVTPQKKNSYVLEDTVVELSRLLYQNDLLTRYEGGILPERDSLVGISSILDAVCGPGGWALEAANHLPDVKIIGVDGSKRMIAHAQDRAARMGYSNLRFMEIDITAPMWFPDNTFDIINTRCAQGVLNKATWPTFLAECQRMLRPGGTIRLTERVYTESNSGEFNQMIALLLRAMHESNRSFALDPHSAGIAYMLAPMLREQHFQRIRSRGWTIDYSADAEGHAELSQFARITFSPHVIGAFCVKAGVTTATEYEHIFDQAMASTVSPLFRGSSFFLTITGECNK